MQLTVDSLGPGQSLPGINMVQQPRFSRITIRAFTAGQIPDKVGQRMVQAARQVLRAVSSSLSCSNQDVQS